jgi:AcrR family transcriptional regulator
MTTVGEGPGDRAGISEMLWERRAHSTRGRKPTLSLEAIARTGIAIADAEGLAATTMQRVGEALGVTKMALYRHVPGKDALVALMLDTGLGEPPRLENVPGGWRSKLARWAREMFELFSRHPWAIEVAVGARVMGPNELGWLEQALAALDGVRLEGSEKFDVAATLSWHVRASAQQAAASAGESPEEELFAGIAALLRGREERFPSVAAALAGTARESQDQALDFGLDRFLDGVELLIAGRG